MAKSNLKKAGAKEIFGNMATKTNANDTNSTDARYLLIDVEDIEESPENEVIYEISKEDLSGIAESISSDGQLNAIRAWLRPDGKYQIIGGHRRYLGVLKNEGKQIEIKVEEWEKNPRYRMRAILDDNIWNREYNFLTIARECKAYIENEIAIHEEELGRKLGLKETAAFRKKIIDELAKKKNRNYSTLYRILALNDLIPELQEKATDPSYSYGALTLAAKLSTDKQKLYNDALDKYVETVGRRLTQSASSHVVSELYDDKNSELDVERVVKLFADAIDPPASRYTEPEQRRTPVSTGSFRKLDFDMEYEGDVTEDEEAYYTTASDEARGFESAFDDLGKSEFSPKTPEAAKGANVLEATSNGSKTKEVADSADMNFASHMNPPEEAVEDSPVDGKGEAEEGSAEIKYNQRVDYNPDSHTNTDRVKIAITQFMPFLDVALGCDDSEKGDITVILQQLETKLEEVLKGLAER